MRERRTLRSLASLSAVQQARRTAAEGVLAEAASIEQRARLGEEEAVERCADASQQWSDYVRTAGFCPDTSLSLSRRLLARENERLTRSREADQAEKLHAQRRAEWQVLEAQVRAGQETANRLKRKLGRKVEEKRLAEAADRTTVGWRGA
jgi:hypothetical protein